MKILIRSRTLSARSSGRTREPPRGFVDAKESSETPAVILRCQESPLGGTRRLVEIGSNRVFAGCGWQNLGGQPNAS